LLRSKAGEIVAAAGLDRAGCENVTRVQATRLLEIVREQCAPSARSVLVMSAAMPSRTIATPSNGEIARIHAIERAIECEREPWQRLHRL
jgi:hypothetical protein